MPLPKLDLPILTDRLVLRLFTEEDSAERHRVFSDRAIREFFMHDDDGSLEASDRQLAKDIRQQGLTRWALAVRDRDSRTLIGACVLQSWNGECELVLGLIEDFRGKRLGPELGRAAISAAFRDGTIDRIVVRIAARNIRSLDLAAALEMTEIGTDENTWAKGEDRRFQLRRPDTKTSRNS